MSISTRSCCSTSYGSGMASKASPHARRTGGVPANTRADVRKDSQTVKKAWENELKGRIQAYPGTVDDFITNLVPCTTPFTFDPAAKWVFWAYKPEVGKEVSSYPHLVRRSARRTRSCLCR